jgi:hypothetical protein
VRSAPHRVELEAFVAQPELAPWFTGHGRQRVSQPREATFGQVNENVYLGNQGCRVCEATE